MGSIGNELRLSDGRRIRIHSVEIKRSTAGMYSWNSTAWAHLLQECQFAMGWQEGMPRAYVVPPAPPYRGDEDYPRPPPEWLVCVKLASEPVRPELVYDSLVVLVFFCDDISESTVVQLVAPEVARMTESLWLAHCWDGDPF